MRKRVAISIICFFVLAFLFGLGKDLFFYKGKYQPPASERSRFEDITVPTPVPQPFAESYKKQAGTFVIDLAHDNRFAPRELNVLLSRVVSRGFAFQYLNEEEKETPQQRLGRMEEKLRYADALGIILPRTGFLPGEVELLKGFVKKGGKLLLIGDPTRPSEINSVSAEFGLLFETDYLYNLVEYDGNYQNVFISEFAQADGITGNLAKIALYSAGSISSADRGIAFTDENTRSSVRETKGKLSPLALTEGTGVLAISDLTFMREPYNAFWDNNQLISNIADWLSKSRRVFPLSDFPYFLEDGAYIGYADPSMIPTAVELKNLLRERGKSLEVGKYEDMRAASKDVMFIGFFKDASKVAGYLERGKLSVTVKTGVKKEKEPARDEKIKEKPASEAEEGKVKKSPEEEVIETKIEIGDIGQVYREEGTSILYLDQKDGRDVLIILSDSEKMMKDTIASLKEGKFRNWLISDKLGIHYAPKTEVKAR